LKPEKNTDNRRIHKMRQTTGIIHSEKGFYIGDICYVLNREIYDKVWGSAEYADGKYIVPGTSREFIVARTAWGDGFYEDGDGCEYPVDAGNIGLVPLELCERPHTDNGRVISEPGDATYTAEDGVFIITLPSGKTVTIDTAK
jgi:hypothetical protein